GAVLTLPGIAGIVLTIGISVDANVLIFERIREELAKGKGQKESIKDGFSNALSSILDANITTGLTALILFIFGSGPIKGFATTLLIGIGTSLFTAIFITRLLVDWNVNKGGLVAVQLWP
ncbi:MAG: MMPL family transporter, partial [Bacteroidota bacterium]